MSPKVFPSLSGVHCLRPSRPLHCCACLALSSSNSNAPHQAAFLLRSLGLSSDEALQASSHLQHLSSPDKPQALLLFLRDMGISEADIRSAVLREPRILCSGLDTNWRPNIAMLQEAGFPLHDISALIARRPYLFLYNFTPKLRFWMHLLRSFDFLSLLLRSDPSLLSSSLQKVLIPNLCFFKDQCGFSRRHIVRLIKSNPRLISSNPQVVKMQAQRADALGVARSSGTFLHALILVTYLNDETLNARFNNLRNLGLSQEEVATIVSKLPVVLSQREEMMARKVKFLLNECGCDTQYLVNSPSLLSYSLDTRLIPRNHVRNLLKSKKIPVADQSLATFVTLPEERFLAKFVKPYQHLVPGLHKAYAAAGAKVKEIE